MPPHSRVYVCLYGIALPCTWSRMTGMHMQHDTILCLLPRETNYYHTQPIAQYLRVAAISRTRTRLSSSGSGSRAGHASPECRGAPRFEGGVCAQRTATRLELTLATRRNVAHARA